MAYQRRDLARVAAHGPLDLPELLDLLGSHADQPGRKQAVACFVAGAEGWQNALEQLHGAFAEGESGLTRAQSE